RQAPRRKTPTAEPEPMEQDHSADTCTASVVGEMLLARAIIETKCTNAVILRQRLQHWLNEGEMSSAAHGAAVQVLSECIDDGWTGADLTRLARAVNNRLAVNMFNPSAV